LRGVMCEDLRSRQRWAQANEKKNCFPLADSKHFDLRANLSTQSVSMWKAIVKVLRGKLISIAESPNPRQSTRVPQIALPREQPDTRLGKSDSDWRSNEQIE
jgi:hypothetical protein